MTPAKLIALTQIHGEFLEMQALPVDKLGWLYANANRDPGEKDEHGNIKRPPADPYELKEFRTTFVRRGKKSLAAKDPTRDPNLTGAKADRGAWGAWSKKGKKKGK